MKTLQLSRTYALILALFALCSLIFSTSVFLLSEQSIARAQKEQGEKLLRTVLADHYTDEVIAQCYRAPSDRYPLIDKVYLAKNDGKMTALAVESHTFEGYSGRISLIQGFNADGSLIAVRVLNHSETPGLGDKIDTNKSHWIEGFNGKKFDRNLAHRFAVKKDGGEFDAFTGATITPRAVVKSVKNTSQLVIEQFIDNPSLILNWQPCEH